MTRVKINGKWEKSKDFTQFKGQQIEITEKNLIYIWGIEVFLPNAISYYAVMEKDEENDTIILHGTQAIASSVIPKIYYTNKNSEIKEAYPEKIENLMLYAENDWKYFKIE